MKIKLNTKFGELILINPNLIFNLKQIINSNEFYCLFYFQNKNIFKKINKKLTIDKDYSFFEVDKYSLIDCPNFNNVHKKGYFGIHNKTAKNLRRYGFANISIKDEKWLDLIDDARKKLIFHLNQTNLAPKTSIRIQDAWDAIGIEEVKKIACHYEILLA